MLACIRPVCPISYKKPVLSALRNKKESSMWLEIIALQNLQILFLYLAMCCIYYMLWINYVLKSKYGLPIQLFILIEKYF
jgi:hypothetical protein